MSRDYIIRMIYEAKGLQLSDRQFQLHGLDTITHFAALIVNAEREAAAERAWKVLINKGADWSVRQMVSDAIKGETA